MLPYNSNVHAVRMEHYCSILNPNWFSENRSLKFVILNEDVFYRNSLPHTSKEGRVGKNLYFISHRDISSKKSYRRQLKLPPPFSICSFGAVVKFPLLRGD